MPTTDDLTKPGPERDAAFRRLWLADATGKQIAERLAINPSSVHQIANRLGLPKRGHRTQLRKRK